MTKISGNVLFLGLSEKGYKQSSSHVSGIVTTTSYQPGVVTKIYDIKDWGLFIGNGTQNGNIFICNNGISKELDSEVTINQNDTNNRLTTSTFVSKLPIDIQEKYFVGDPKTNRVSLTFELFE